MKKRHTTHGWPKTVIAAACAVPYLIFAGAGITSAHAAGGDTHQDGHEHTTPRATRRTDTLEVYLGPDDVTERDVAVEVEGAWSVAADVVYDNHGNAAPVGAATFADMDFKASGEGAMGLFISGGRIKDADAMTVNLLDSRILMDGEDALGVYLNGDARLRLENVDVHLQADPGSQYAGGIAANADTRVELRGGAMRTEHGFGIEANNGARVAIDSGQIVASGQADAHGLKLIEFDPDGRPTPANHITLTGNSVVQAPDASAVWVDSRSANRLDATDSRLSGDRLVTVAEHQGFMGAWTAGARLRFNADNSQLAGGSSVHALSRLAMNLRSRSDWAIHPTAAGQTRSDVTFLSVEESDIRFHDAGTGLYQRLVVGHGDTGGRTDVYQALGGNARVHLNTRLNDGGALVNQHTDRLIVLGDASGSTWLQVNPVAGSTGAETGDTASDGISVAQVYGQARADTFKLVGDYVAVGPYQYRLQAFDPATSDPDQRDAAGSGGAFWDFRLLGAMTQSGFGDSTTPDVVPQLPSYLAAPTALFQARLFDIDTWHRRLGDARGAGGDTTSQTREFFLRSYGGDYDYRSQSGASSYAAKTRYRAVQVGGNAVSATQNDATWRAGAAVSVGDLSFQPQGIDGNRKTRLQVWSVSPTITWQHDGSEGHAGGYVDALVALGGFKGDVTTRQRGRTATLKGKSAAASVEVGVPFDVAGLTVLPQVQAVYQHLKFDRSRDVDGINVKLGSHQQLTLRGGGELRKAFQTRAGHAIQVYGKVHVAHTLEDSKKVKLSGDFRTGKTGTVLEAGVGVDAALAKGRGVVYADVTRQNRIGRAGHNGWTANVGVRVRF